MMEEDKLGKGLFDDEDEALDYILYQDLENEDRNMQSKGGCLSSIALLLLMPSSGICLIVRYFGVFQ